MLFIKREKFTVMTMAFWQGSDCTMELERDVPILSNFIKLIEREAKKVRSGKMKKYKLIK